MKKHIDPTSRLLQDLPVCQMTTECEKVLVQTFNWFFLKYVVNPLAAIKSANSAWLWRRV